MAVLMHYGLRSHLLTDIPPTVSGDEAKAQEWKTKDERVLGDLILSIAIPLRGIVRGAETAKKAWEKVLAVYETKLASNVLHLKKELYQCRMEDVTAKDAMQTHISRMRNLIDRLASVGTNISAEDAGVQLYLSLPDSYSHISAALSLKPVNELTFDVVAAVLLQEERRLQGLASASLSATAKAESALAATSSPAGNSNARVNTPRPRCQYCNKKGHTEGVCYQKHGYPVGHPLHGKDKNSPHPPHAHFAYSAVVVDELAPAGPAAIAASPYAAENTSAILSAVQYLPAPSSGAGSNQVATTEWWIDSGASQHICGVAEWFATYQPVKNRTVALANGHRIAAVGRGDIHVDMQLNGRLETGIFRDVLHGIQPPLRHSTDRGRSQRPFQWEGVHHSLEGRSSHWPRHARTGIHLHVRHSRSPPCGSWPRRPRLRGGRGSARAHGCRRCATQSSGHRPQLHVCHESGGCDHPFGVGGT